MNRRMTKTGLFLMELLLVLLIFSVAAAVCLRIFATAGLESRGAVDLSEAAVAAQSAAESFRAAGGNLEQTAQLLDGQLAAGTVQVCFADDWQPAPTAGDRGLGLTVTANGPVGQITVTADNGQTAIFDLSVRVPGGEGQ